MTSPTDICNVALGLLGDQRIADINAPGSGLAELLQRFYVPARRALLAMNRWQFASGWMRLSLLTEAPAAEWLAQYAIAQSHATAPQPVAIWDLSDHDVQWARGYDPITRQQVVYTDTEHASLAAYATFDLPDTSQWNPLAVQVLAHKLAADIVLSRTGQTAKWQAMTQAMQFWIGQATAKDGMGRAQAVQLNRGLTRIR
jgi:hypothetical protein